jgi:hypothetical protein
MSELPFPISYPENAPMDFLAKSPLIAQWSRSISPAFHIDRVDLVTADIFGSRIGCIELDVFCTANVHSHQERIILHGRAVIVVVLIRCPDTDQLFTVLVQQPRLGCGHLMYEFPAGMAEDTADMRIVAAHELAEEVAMAFDPSKLIPLSELLAPDHPFTYSSPSNYDQHAMSFAAMREMPRDVLDEYEGKNCGATQDEQITLHVVPFEDAWRYVREPATLAVIWMVMELVERGLMTL